MAAPASVVQVALEPSRLRERGVDVLRLQQTLAAANLGMPSGTVLDTDGPGIAGTMQTGEFLRSADDVGELVVGVNQGKPVYLREVAEVKAAAGQATRYVWYTPGGAERRRPGPLRR